MTDSVLVTGGFGLVGSATVRQLAADGRSVVIADLETPANVKKAQALPYGVEVRWADLTDADQVQHLISEVAPLAIIQFRPRPVRRVSGFWIRSLPGTHRTSSSTRSANDLRGNISLAMEDH